MRSTTVSHPHTLTKPSLSCPRGLQLLYPTSARGRWTEVRASGGSAGLVGLCYIHMELGRAGEGMGTGRDNHKTLLLTTKKVLPDQRLFPLVPSHCYTCAQTNTYMHTSIHIWSCPHIHTCTHMHHMNVISWAYIVT